MNDSAADERSGGRIAVTGATGALGDRVARLLADRGQPLRLLVRDTDRAPDLPDCEVAAAPYADAEAVKSALEGIRTVFMVSASEAEDRLDQHRTFIDAAIEAGVQHIVYTSFAGASPHAVFTYGRTHHATEQHLIDAGVAHTVLRNNFYADILPAFVVDGKIRGPAGLGCVAAVAREDIAEAAVTVLLDPAAYAGDCIDLTGPAALTLEEVADILTSRGHEAVYVDETLEDAYAWRRESGEPDWKVEGWVSTYTAIAAGEVAAVGTGVRALTGHQARTLEEALDGLDPADD